MFFNAFHEEPLIFLWILNKAHILCECKFSPFTRFFSLLLLLSVLLAFIWRLNKSNVLIAHLFLSLSFRLQCSFRCQLQTNFRINTIPRIFFRSSLYFHMKYRCIESETSSKKYRTTKLRFYIFICFHRIPKKVIKKEKVFTTNNEKWKRTQLYCVCIKKDICLLLESCAQIFNNNFLFASLLCSGLLYKVIRRSKNECLRTQIDIMNCSNSSNAK